MGMRRMMLRQAGVVNPFQDANIALSLRSLGINPNKNKIEAFRVANNDVDVFNANQIQNTNDLQSFGGASDLLVRTWYDETDNDNHAIQTDELQMPKIYDSSSGSLILDNGKPALLFDNSGNDTLDLINISTNKSIFLVLSTTYTTAGIYANFILGDTSTQPAYHGDKNSTIFDERLIVNNIKNGNNYLNGVLSDFGTTSTPTSQSLISMLHTGNVSFDGISYDRDFSGRSWRGYRQCVIGFNDNSENLRNKVEANINNFYNIYP